MQKVMGERSALKVFYFLKLMTLRRFLSLTSEIFDIERNYFFFIVKQGIVGHKQHLINGKMIFITQKYNTRKMSIPKIPFFSCVPNSSKELTALFQASGLKNFTSPSAVLRKNTEILKNIPLHSEQLSC